NAAPLLPSARPVLILVVVIPPPRRAVLVFIVPAHAPGRTVVVLIRFPPSPRTVIVVFILIAPSASRRRPIVLVLVAPAVANGFRGPRRSGIGRRTATKQPLDRLGRCPSVHAFLPHQVSCLECPGLGQLLQVRGRHRPLLLAVHAIVPFL